jgi:uncharacterized protein (DUF2235 family)
MAETNRPYMYPIQSSEYIPHPKLAEKIADGPQSSYPASIRGLKSGKDSDDHQRTIIICLDGTGDQFDGDNSNVVHFVSCLKKHTPSKQCVYYQSGIGTYGKGGLKNG